MFKDDDEEEENTFGVTRYPCMPSLVALQQMRNRRHLAFLGRKLMKWTALATGRELRRLAQELYDVYDGFGEDLRNAFILLARSRYFCPTLNSVVTEDIGKKAGVLVQQSGKTVSGVKIIQFEIFETEYPPYPHLGLDKGGQTVMETKKAWLELLKRLIMMMQLRAGFLMVELANKNANKKWNVLSKMVIPRVNLSCHYITSELEEIEREDNFRLKRFKELKIKKQKAKEVPVIKTIPEECPVCAQEGDSSICSCKSNIVTPEKDKTSICSVYKGEENEIEKDNRSGKHIQTIEFIDEKDTSRKQSENSIEGKISDSNFKQNIFESCMSKHFRKDSKDSKVIKFIDQKEENNDKDSDKYSVYGGKQSKAKSEIKVIDQKIVKEDSNTISTISKVKSIEFISQRELNRKDSNNRHNVFQADSNISTDQTEHKETEIICPICKTKIKTSSKEYPKGCKCMIPGADTSTEESFSPVSQTEANIKSNSNCSCSQLSNVKLPSDKDIKSVSSDKFCSTIDRKEFKLKEIGETNSCEPSCKRDGRKPEEENNGNQKIMKNVKEIKIKKLPDTDDNIRVEKRTITTTSEKKIALSKCCSENNIYKKPSYAGSNRTIKASKLKLTGKVNQMSDLKLWGSASIEFSKPPCCDRDQNKSNNSTSQSASVASVDYSCSDKPISECDICSDTKAPEETKTTQTYLKCSSNTPTENEKPKSSYCIIKIFAKAESNVPTDESNSIELTPSAVDLLRKILLKARRSNARPELSMSQTNQKCDCSTKPSGKLIPKSTYSTNEQSIPNKLTGRENTQNRLYQSKLEVHIQDKEETPKKSTCQKPNNEGAQTIPSPPPPHPESIEIAGREMKNVSTGTITATPTKSRSDIIKKHSCIIKVDEPKHSLIKKKSSAFSCKTKKSFDNKEWKCSCSKVQSTPKYTKQKTCTCSKSQSNEGKCKCNRKEETTKTCSCSAPRLTCTCKTSKPNLKPKFCNLPKSGTIRTSDLIDPKKCLKCVVKNEPSASSVPDTKDVATQKQSLESMSKYCSCSQDKSSKSKTNVAASECSLCGKKDASTSTRRSDRYDVRPLRLLMLSRKTPCPCVSDSVILKNQRPKNTKLRRCSSYSDRQQYG